MTALLFLHGAGCTAEAFAHQRDAFRNAHMPNLPGHVTPGSPESIADFAAAMEAYVRDEIGAPVVVCGHSMGAAIALELALRGRVRPAGLVLLGGGARMRVAPAFLDGLTADFEATARTLAGYFFAEPAPERIDAAVDSMVRVGAGQTLRDFRACDAFDVAERLGGIDVPALALTGEADKMTPPKYAQFLADRIPGAQARIVAGAGHFVMVERPQETNAAIASFVERLQH